MPINGKPLLEIWLDTLQLLDIKKVLINLHYKKELVIEFMKRPKFRDWVDTVYEADLLGTAGTLRQNYFYLKDKVILMVHADNLCICNFRKFLEYHINFRPKPALMTMMTFHTITPETCGIVEVDKKGIVWKFHEKVKNPPSNLANAAIYLLEPEILEWIMEQENISDFSTQVIPYFMGKIATWKNDGIMRDIGNIESLKIAQKEVQFDDYKIEDEWQKLYKSHPIHNLILQS